MRNEEQGARDNFIVGFGNPITESSAESVDKADGQVTVIGYRPLPEDGHKDGIKGKLEFYVAALLSQERGEEAGKGDYTYHVLALNFHVLGVISVSFWG